MKPSFSLHAAPHYQHKDKGRKKINLIFFTTTSNHFQSLFSFVGTGKAQTKLKNNCKEYYCSCKSKLWEMRFFFLGYLHFDIFYICMILYCFSQNSSASLSKDVLWAWIGITSWMVLLVIRPLSDSWHKLQNVK